MISGVFCRKQTLQVASALQFVPVTGDAEAEL